MKLFCAWSFPAVALLLASCASPIARRIEGNPQVFNALNEHQRNLVQRGAIEEGMSKEAVTLAWGKPDRVSIGRRAGKAYDRWSYAGYEPVFSGPYGLGMYDPYNYYPGPGVTYLPYEARWAEFLDNRVSGWSVRQ